MANDEHLRILKQGVEAWHRWRTKNPEIEPDLNEADLSNAELSSVDLNFANLSRACLSGAHLEGAELRHTNLSRANLSHASLSGANLKGANLSNTDFTHSNLVDARLLEVNLYSAKFRLANLHRADFSKARLEFANFTESNLIKANLSHANFRYARIKNTVLRNTVLRFAQFKHAEINDSDLSYSDLSYAELQNSNLRGSNLTGANLHGADVSQSRIGGTIFADIDLSEVKGLEDAIHSGPSEISVSTITLSKGVVQETFLRGCGVPEEFIIQIPALVTAIQPIQFYSCFISYSNKDEPFANRLHERMRATGLRVWFAPKDIQGGDKLYEQIDRAIQVHDRLLLVLSENSLKSEWVKTEIRRARTTEIKENRRKLFPIRLIDFDKLKEWECFDADHGKDLAVEIREYFIPDFSNWKSHDDFEKAFARVLSDLKASTQ